MAFRDGDSGEKGRLGALMLAEGLQILSTWHKEWRQVHTKKK